MLRKKIKEGKTMEATEEELASQLKRAARFEHVYKTSFAPLFVEMTGSIGGDTITYRISKKNGNITER
jgi:hypothetical protein